MDESTLNCSHCCKRYHETCVSVYLGDHISVNSWICSECISTIFPFNQYVHKTDFIDVLSESWYNWIYPSMIWVTNVSILLTLM